MAVAFRYQRALRNVRWRWVQSTRVTLFTSGKNFPYESSKNYPNRPIDWECGNVEKKNACHAWRRSASSNSHTLLKRAETSVPSLAWRSVLRLPHFRMSVILLPSSQNARGVGALRQPATTSGPIIVQSFLNGGPQDNHQRPKRARNQGTGGWGVGSGRGERGSNLQPISHSGSYSSRNLHVDERKAVSVT
ncbi:hypothetical protein ZHAS_00018640 [Anopheles sinensis]|uniref:Uncharacterized protein n=1 Tax=Anopheles sinensis TaxID=74873 RepID=A0A084WJH3_ANOSI|nr:hypothetical protein ZHAS_00018640 [Anopheles sinensis]